jgi:hypothetical protein
MLDIRAVAYIAPVSEVDYASVALTVRITNVADESGLVTGKFRVYNDFTGLLIHTSDIVPFSLAAGATIDASALTDFDPPAPADDVYFVIFDGKATNALVPDGITFTLGQFYFDVKPIGMGPAPAAHHATHELGGSDEIDVTGLFGDQTPLPHYRDKHLGLLEHSEVFGNGSLYTTPWGLNLIGAGSSTGLPGSSNHIGIQRFSSSINANSGITLILLYRIEVLLAGTETSDFILRPQTLAGTTIRAGFHDCTTSVDAVDGAYLEIAQVGGVDGTVVGKCASNSVRSTTASSYLLTTNTWYRLRIAVDATAALVTFTLLSEAGITLWTDTLSTNIPTAAGRETGHGIAATNSGTTAVALVDLDYLDMHISRTLTR